MMQEWLLGVGSVLLEVVVAFQGRRPAWRSPLNVSVSPSFHLRHYFESHERGDLVVVLVSGLIFYECCKVLCKELGGGAKVGRYLGRIERKQE